MCLRYWQITTARLSRAARKLDYDGLWHTFHSTPYAWYRVWNKRLVQRANFSSYEEEHLLLPLVEQLSPLPEMATVTGFREELNIDTTNDRFEVKVPLGYAPEYVDVIRSTLSVYGISIWEEESPLLYAYLPLVALTTPDLTRVQAQIAAVRLFFQAAISSDSSKAMEAARLGFERIMIQ